MNSRPPTEEVHLKLLKQLQGNPFTSQRELAETIGVSLGKVNYCLQALIEVGLIKASNFAKSADKKRYIYLITPKGVAEKTRLTARFLEAKQAQYDALKKEIEDLKRDIGVAD